MINTALVTSIPYLRSLSIAILVQFVFSGCTSLNVVELLKVQNELLKKQNELSELRRGDVQFYELTALLNEIDEELDANEESEQRGEEDFVLSLRLLKRISALTRGEFPKFKNLGNLEEEHSGVKSVIRGHLMRAIVGIGIDLEYIARHSDFSYCDLSFITFEAAQLEGLNGSLSNFRSSQFVGANLNSASFIYSVFIHSILEDSFLSKANFTSANLSKAMFLNCDLTEAWFNAATLTGAAFTESNLNKTNFNNANLSKAYLGGIKNWKHASWSGANVYKVEDAPEGFLDHVLNNGAVQKPPKEE